MAKKLGRIRSKSGILALQPGMELQCVLFSGVTLCGLLQGVFSNKINLQDFSGQIHCISVSDINEVFTDQIV